MNSSADEDRDHFATTRWTLVVQAGGKETGIADRALADLCLAYWYPLYAYVRRQGRSREDAEDLTQAFFARFLEKNYLAGLSAERGRFRAFLLAAMKHFLANEWDKANRLKRGGGAVPLSLDWQAADERFHIEPADPDSPEKSFDREWALALLERVLQRLEAECEGAGKGALFSSARGYLMIGETAIPYADAARALGVEESAMRVAVHRLRKRYREILRAEIAQTLADPAMVEEELRSLLAALT
jgi:DNA-directed RNA polymerase specialized sigma24 family protein